MYSAKLLFIIIFMLDFHAIIYYFLELTASKLMAYVIDFTITQYIASNFCFKYATVTVGTSIHLYVKSQDPFKMSFKFKYCNFFSVPILLKKKTNTFDSSVLNNLL